MSSDLFDALTVALIVTIFSSLLTPTLVWLFKVPAEVKE